MFPLIGVSARLTNDRYTLNQDYCDALQAAGATVILILPDTPERLREVLLGLDGILIPGGGDIDPNYYDQSNSHSTIVSSEIDELDLSLCELAMELHLPLFGICRGLQIINVAMGGSLIQDIRDRNPKSLDHTFSAHNRQPQNAHEVSLRTDTKLSGLLGERCSVNSYHHQAIDKVAEGLLVSALSDDGIIEAVEGTDILAVQWHPERMQDIPIQFSLFSDFTNACNNYKTKRSRQ